MADWRGELRAITFDFGNTLVHVDREGLARVVAATARAMSDEAGPFDVGEVLAIWAEERARLFREDVPAFREVDLAERVVRVLARLRGMPPPPAERPWDQPAAAGLSTTSEVAAIIERYSRAFVESMPPVAGVDELLATLARRYRLAILSNWPLAATVERYAEAAGWLPSLAAIVISQRVGTIKPSPVMFAAARQALGEPEPAAILHVGDDWAADVVGAKTAGWRAAYIRHRPKDSPLPSSPRGEETVADLELASVVELPQALGDAAGTAGNARALT